MGESWGYRNPSAGTLSLRSDAGCRWMNTEPVVVPELAKDTRGFVPEGRCS
jgi:hypothetical protein